MPSTCPSVRQLTASCRLTRCPLLARSSCLPQRIRRFKLVPKLTVRVRFPLPAPHAKDVATVGIHELHFSATRRSGPISEQRERSVGHPRATHSHLSTGLPAVGSRSRSEEGE